MALFGPKKASKSGQNERILTLCDIKYFAVRDTPDVISCKNLPLKGLFRSETGGVGPVRVPPPAYRPPSKLSSRREGRGWVENGVKMVKNSTSQKSTQKSVFEVGEPEKRGFRAF